MSPPPFSDAPVGCRHKGCRYHPLLAQRLDIRHNLPSPFLWQARPRRHTLPQISVPQKIHQFRRRFRLHVRRLQIRRLADSVSIGAVTFRAMLPKEFFSRTNLILAADVRLLFCVRRRLCRRPGRLPARPAPPVHCTFTAWHSETEGANRSEPERVSDPVVSPGTRGRAR